MDWRAWTPLALGLSAQRWRAHREVGIEAGARLVRMAMAAGVRVVDTSAAPGMMDAAEVAVGRALGASDGSAIVLARWAAPGASPAPLDARWTALVDRLSGRPADVLVITPDPSRREDVRQVIGEARGLRSTGRIAGWGLRLGHGPDVPEHARIALREEVNLLIVPLNLLDARPGPEVERMVRSSETRLLPVDPFAAGLLDGAPLRSLPFEGPSSARPPSPLDVQRLHRAAAPVLRLGFLTARTGRTLPGAALRYLQSLPGVASVEVEPRDPGELVRWIREAQCPPLTDNEVERLEALRDAAVPRRGSIA